MRRGRKKADFVCGEGGLRPRLWATKVAAYGIASDVFNNRRANCRSQSLAAPRLIGHGFEMENLNDKWKIVVGADLCVCPFCMPAS